MVLDSRKLPPFIPGIDLNRLFFQQVVKPLIDKNFPGLKYSAALIGEGSDVLRFDNPTSMDHNWGPHLRIFLSETDYKTKKDEINHMLRHQLPYEFMGFPTNFTEPNEAHYLVQQMQPIKSGPVNHFIQFYTIKNFWQHYLGFDPSRAITTDNWLVFPQQALIEVTAGEVYYDGLQKLEATRAKFAYYPDNVWIYLYTMQWDRIANAEAFMGRTASVGDELGSNLIANGIVNDLMRLCFYIEKKYYPYNKWFGTAFSRLKSAPDLIHILLDTVHSQNFAEREENIVKAYEIIVGMHNALGLTKPLRTTTKNYHGRPYKVIDAHTAVHETFKAVKDPYLRRLKYKIGSTDQFVSHARINQIDYIYWEFEHFIGKQGQDPEAKA